MIDLETSVPLQVRITEWIATGVLRAPLAKSPKLVVTTPPFFSSDALPNKLDVRQHDYPFSGLPKLKAEIDIEKIIWERNAVKTVDRIEHRPANRETRK